MLVHWLWTLWSSLCMFQLDLRFICLRIDSLMRLEKTLWNCFMPVPTSSSVIWNTQLVDYEYCKGLSWKNSDELIEISWTSFLIENTDSKNSILWFEAISLFNQWAKFTPKVYKVFLISWHETFQYFCFPN